MSSPVAAETAVAVDVTKDKKDEAGGEFGKDTGKPFVPSTGLTSAEAEELLKIHGRNELEEHVKPKWKLFVEQFYQPMPCMIWCAIVVELGLSIEYGANWPDFGVLCGLQAINGSLSFYEANKAGNAVAALKKSLKPNAVCKRDGKWNNTDAGVIVPGDLVMLGAGAAVPADCIVNAGRIEVDQAALTGESLPVTMTAGSKPKMGSTVTRGEVEATVEFTGGKTFFGKTASMIQSVEEMSHFTKVLLRIMAFLISISIVLCCTVLGFLMQNEEQSFPDAISFAVVLLVASIPMAMEVVTTTTMAIGSHTLSHAGAIVARLSSIEELAGMNMLCSDKTGTLTMNKMVIQEETPIYEDGLVLSDVLKYAALAAKWHEPPKDALDTLVLGAVNMSLLDRYEMVDYQPFDPILKRTEGTLRDTATGKLMKTTKGAPHVIAKLVTGPGADEVHASVNAKVDNFAERGIRSLAVARTTNAEGEPDAWQMCGILTFLDPPRPDTKETLHRAMEFGIDVKMITGDHVAIAKETARQLGIGTNILNATGLPSLNEDGSVPKDLAKFAPMIIEADGFAQVFPEHKFLIVEALRRSGYAVGMTGDGVNDAPALKKADIGVAVQGATDAARAAADIVLTSPGLSVVIDAITISRCIFQRIQNFVLYRVACTLQLLFFFFIAVLAFQPSEYARGFRSYPHKYNTDNAVLAVMSRDKGDATGKPGGVLVIWEDSACPVHTWHLDQIAAAVQPSFSQNLTADYIKNLPAFTESVATGTTTTTLGDITGPLCLEQWPRTFALPVIALIFITLLNDGTIISIAYDHVEPSHYPEKWNLPVSFIISGVLGAVAFAGSILYLHLSAWRMWGLGPISYGQVAAAIYLKVSLSDFLTLFSARTTSFFFTIKPDIKLVFAAFAALGASTVLTSQWPTALNEKKLEEKYMEPAAFADNSEYKRIYDLSGTRMNGTPDDVLGVTWLYCVIWWLVQDVVKVVLYKVLEHFDVLGHKTIMLVNARGEDGFATGLTKEQEIAATGHVEGKLVAMDVREMQSTVTTMEPAVRAQMRPKLADLEAAMKAKDDAKITAASKDIAASVEDIKNSAGRAATAAASLRKKE